MTTTLRRIFPLHSECPKAGCGCTRYTRHGQSRGGDLEYRKCKACGYGYVVTPIGLEVHVPGQTTSHLRMV